MPHPGRFASVALLAAACFHDDPPALKASTATTDSSGPTTPTTTTGSDATPSTAAAPEPTTGADATTLDITSSTTTGCAPTPWYLDADADGHGDPATLQLTCPQPDDHVAIGDDCDDADPMRAPGLDEVCDQQDNDCDPFIDEHSPSNPSCLDCALFARPPSSYAFCPTARPSPAARPECMQRGGDLVVVDDADENLALAAQGAATMGTIGAWYIGLNDIAVENDFVWLDGIPAMYTAWDTGEPNDLEGEDCVVLRDTADWNDQTCALATPFVCELATGP